MAHAHTHIRAALVAALTGLTTTGTRVYAQRRLPLSPSQLPALRLYIDSESAEDLTSDSPVAQQRRPVVVVECCDRHSDSLDTRLDQMSLEVELALSAGITVGSADLSLEYTGFDTDDDQLEKPIGIKRLTYAMQYHALATAPDTLI